MVRWTFFAIALFSATTAQRAAAASAPVTALAYHPGGKTIVAGAAGRVRAFDASNGKEIGTARDVPGRVTALEFSRDGTTLAVACGEPSKVGTVDLFRVSANGTVGVRFASIPKAHADSIYALAFRPDGRILATAGYDRLIQIWDISPPKEGAAVAVLSAPLRTLKDHSDTIYALAFHPEGRLLASGAADRAVKVWDAETGVRLYTLGESTDWVYAVAWRPDGRQVAAGGVDKSLRVWNANRDGGKIARTAFAHEGALLHIAYALDGQSLFTVGEDKVIKAWDSATLQEKAVLPAQPETVLGFALRGDGKQVAVGRFDGVAQLLNSASGRVQAALLPVKPKPLAIKSVTPAFAPRGRATVVVFRGENLDEVRAISASGGGITIIPEAKDSSSVQLKATVTISAQAPVGPVELIAKGDGGDSSPASFLVDRFPAVAEAASATDSARNAMSLVLPRTVFGSIDRAGDVDFFRFEVGAGEQIGAQAIAAEVGSKLEPLLVLTDEAGHTLAEGTTALGYTTPKAGTYAIGLRDRDFRGGPGMKYRLHVGPIPVVTSVFPLGATRGRTTEVRLNGVNLAGRTSVSVTVPADAVPGSKVAVKVPIASNEEAPLGLPAVVVDEFPASIVGPDGTVSLESVPASADGRLARPGEAHTIHFTAKKGERLIVEVNARRLGSPLDSTIAILDSAGRPVPRAVLRSTSRTFIALRDQTAVSPGIRLETWNDLKINDYMYADGELIRIVEMPKNPDDDCQFYQVGGQRLGFLGTTPTFHPFAGALYRVEVHPPGQTFAPNGMPVFPIYYRNDDGGPGYGADSMLEFDSPADGSYSVRVTDTRGAGGPDYGYRLTVRPPRPDFSISFRPTAPAVWKGGGIPIAVTATRLDGFDGPIRVSLEGLPPGFHAPETFIEGHMTTTSFALTAAADAAVAPAKAPPTRLVARASIAGQEVIREAKGKPVSVAEGGEIAASVRQAEVTIRPSTETRFTVDVERRHGFKGRVPLEVRGLPHGVRVLNIGLNGILVTPRESSREVTVYAEPWVKPMTRPFVVLAIREGKKTEHAANSVLLKVEK